MNESGPRASREEVLEAFAVAFDGHGDVLQRFLVTYPEFAPDLLELSRLVGGSEAKGVRALNAADQALLDEAVADLRLPREGKRTRKGP